ncbi:MAG: type II and III secretion system protein family protein [Proteobacteria bacterium]|nr:type II and III secretion system protein family protein [Pseudomonadota bacterium]
MRGFKFSMAALCGLAALMSWSPASAQEVPKRRPPAAVPAPMPVPQAAKTAVAGEDLSVIELSLNQAKVLTLPRSVSNIVIGNPAIANVRFDPEQPTKIYIVSLAVGSTNIFFIDQNGEIVQQSDIRVVFDHNGIKAALKKLLPNENIDVLIFRDSIFLTGKVHTAAAAADAVNIATRFVGEPANVVNMISVIGGQQVILKVRVAEVDRDLRKQLQVSGFFTTKLGRRSRLSIDLFAPTPTFGNLAIAQLFTGANIFGDPTFGTRETDSLVKTLAEPTLTAISGETASFLSGGEFPFPSGLDENGQTIFEFREFGIRLSFTPVVLDKGRIRLQISTEISALGAVINSQQSLTQKRTDTTIELPSGGTLMISGLLTDDVTDQIDGIPYLKNIPVLGALFRSTEFRRQESELIITVTVYLAKPIDSYAAAALPSDGFEPASDIDIYLLGRLSRHYGDSQHIFWENPLKGAFGYIMK